MISSMGDWNQCFETLSKPLVTEREVDAVLARLDVLQTQKITHPCPVPTAKNLKESLEELRRVCDDVARRDRATELLKNFPRASNATVASFLRDTGADEDGEAVDDDERTLSALWRGFADCSGSEPQLSMRSNMCERGDSGNVGGVIEGVATAAPLNLAREPRRVSESLIFPSQDALCCGHGEEHGMVGVCEMIVESPEITTAEMIVETPEITTAVASNEMTYEKEGCATSGANKTQVRGSFFRKRRRFGRSSWHPGHDVCGWIGRGAGRAIGHQAQVLIVNAYKRLAAVPKKDRATIKKLFPAVRAVRSITFASRAVSGILCVPAKTVENVVAHVTRVGIGKRPVIRRSVTQPGGDVETSAQRPVVTSAATERPRGEGDAVANALVAKERLRHEGCPSGFIHLLRACAFLSSRGMPKDALPHLVHVIMEAKGDVHNSYHNRHFVTVFDRATHDVVVGDLPELLHKPLPGTGRPPDVELIADACSIGKFYSRNRDTIFFIGLQFSVEFPPFTVQLCIGAENEQSDGRCEGLLARLKAAFMRLGQPSLGAPRRSLEDWVAQQISTSSGDGALVAGGPEARHNSTKVMNVLSQPYEEDRATWDDFHAYNTAGSRALGKSAMASKYFSLLKQLEYAFAMGQGRHVHRCVGAFLQQSHLRLAAMCGHRKMGYFAGVPQRFLESYEAVYNSLLVRASHALAGRGSHPFSHFKELGDTFADTQTLVFALAMHGELHHAVEPINNRTQDAADLPWTRWVAFEESCRSHKRYIRSLANLRGWLRVLVLVAPFCADEWPPGRAMRRFWLALIASPTCRPFHHRGRWHLPAHLFPILFTGTFQRCELSLRVRPSDGRTHLVHAACQCATRPVGRALRNLHNTIKAVDHRDWPWWLRLPPGVIGPVQTVRARIPPNRDLVVPWWVKCSQYPVAGLLHGGYNSTPIAVLPRWQTLPTAASEEVRLRQRGCRVPRMACKSLEEIDAGIAHAQAFWADFKGEVEDYCLGDVGVSSHMQEIYKTMSVAFWLLDIVDRPTPSDKHYEALVVLYGHLKKDLKRRPWPPVEYGMTPNVQRWPSTEGLKIYYARWWTGIHNAAQKPESIFRLKWRREFACSVVAVRSSPVVSILVIQHLLKRMVRLPNIVRVFPRDMRLQLYDLADKIWAFLIAPVRSFTVQVSEVKRGEKCSSLATLRTPRMRGRVVRIVRSYWEWDQRCIAASLEHNAQFAENCYHINSMFCLSKRFGKTTSACERWGHEFKYLWDVEQGPATTTLMHRLRARLGGLRGDGTDEELLRRTAAILMRGEHSCRDTKFRALRGWREQRAKQAAHRPPVGFALAPAAVVEEATSVSPFKRWKRTTKASRAQYEPKELEVDDDLFLRRMQRRHLASMPFYAATKKQWDDDLNRTERERLTSERAAAYLASRPVGELSKPAEVLSDTSSNTSSSSDTSSSSSSSVLEEADASRPERAKEVAGASGALEAAAGASDPVVPPAFLDAWVVPRGGKLHHRLDIAGSGPEEFLTFCFCKPFRLLTVGCQRGEGATSAAATGAKWCKNCLNLMAKRS